MSIDEVFVRELAARSHIFYLTLTERGMASGEAMLLAQAYVNSELQIRLIGKRLDAQDKPPWE